ncbi:hypothetical protein BDM02DRAFT_3119823 [Thelephora ganbajun]|uniref:Uncharacterized protein n=1 Tax=Thelephora ganbajun TaxID=370292 RepID=A0ACB6Z833_THEGA|nr:hypothetical protein BDM02DRAFT_3119823 [Thelephora ganbajun]
MSLAVPALVPPLCDSGLGYLEERSPSLGGDVFLCERGSPAPWRERMDWNSHSRFVESVGNPIAWDAVSRIGRLNL